MCYVLSFAFRLCQVSLPLKVPINGSEPGLQSDGKLTDDVHRPVLQIYKKQNRELSYASG
jgi:hypothetical protein